jgi:acetyl esterase/lipase
MRPQGHRYGAGRSQVAELWRPSTVPRPPVIVLLHGGFWRAPWSKRLMHGLAEACVARGWAAWNVEYRRVGPTGGGGGWPSTFLDVASALEALAGVDDLDLEAVVTCGHSAGGHLALWAAARGRFGPDAPSTIALRGAVALAGVVDLAEADRRGLGSGAVGALLGEGAVGSPTRAERMAQASPAALLPLGLPQLLVHGTRDTVVPVAMSMDYATRARAAGDDARAVPLADLDHMALIDPSSRAFPVVAEFVETLLG